MAIAASTAARAAVTSSRSIVARVWAIDRAMRSSIVRMSYIGRSGSAARSASRKAGVAAAGLTAVRATTVKVVTGACAYG